MPSAALPDCTCVHMLFHMYMCWRKGGAAKSRTGNALGGGKKSMLARKAMLEDFKKDFHDPDTVRTTPSQHSPHTHLMIGKLWLQVAALARLSAWTPDETW